MNLLIIDDEQIVREGLKTIFPWAEYGFTAVSYTHLQRSARSEKLVSGFPVPFRKYTTGPLSEPCTWLS